MPLNAFAAFVKKNAGSGLNMTDLSKKYKSQTGGAMSQMGGSKSQMGGSKSQMGGSKSQMGGSKSQMGGSKYQMGGSKSQMGGSKSQMGGSKTYMGGAMSQMGGSKSQMGGSKKYQMGGSKKYQMGGVRSALERQMDDVRPTFNVPKDLSSIPGIPMGVELALLETGLIYSDLEILATDSLEEYKQLFAEAVRSVDPTVSGVNQAAESSYAYFRAQRGGAKKTQKAGAKKTQKAGAKKAVTKRK